MQPASSTEPSGIAGEAMWPCFIGSAWLPAYCSHKTTANKNPSLKSNLSFLQGGVLSFQTSVVGEKDPRKPDNSLNQYFEAHRNYLSCRGRRLIGGAVEMAQCARLLAVRMKI